MGAVAYCAVISVLVIVIKGSDVPCTRKGGKCQMDWTSCSGSYQSGLCAGSARRRCCLPGGDARCTQKGGTCQMDWTSCSGSYQSGLCAGSTRRRCCVPTPTTPGSVNSCPGVRIYSRQEWGARPPKSRKTISMPVGLFFVHHTAGSRCTTVADCKATARQTQNFHMNSRGYSDVGYSFLVGEDGNVYEGRGWGVQGAHTKGYNSISFAASVMGNFESRVPDIKAQRAVKALIRCGVDKGYIRRNYRLYGHRDVGSTACPGQAFYNVIRGWPNYSTTRPGK